MARPSGPAVRTFGAPMRGLVRSVPEVSAGPDALYACNNAVFDQGVLQARQGFKKFSEITTVTDPSFTTQPMGAWMTVESNSDLDVFVATKTKLYRARNVTGSWTDVSGAITLTAGDANNARFTSLYNKADGKTATLVANGKDDMVLSLDGANFTIPISGGPKPMDICSSASRVIGIVYPYKVIWSDIHNAGSFPSLNFVHLVDSPGSVIAVRNLGTQGVAVYKQDAIVAGYSQPGSPAMAFRWEQRASCVGPAWPTAVVEANGLLFHMTARGRIGVFDGTRFEWIGDGSWPFFIEDCQSHTYPWQTMGFYDDSRHVIWFIYPKLSDGANGPTGIAMVTLPRPSWGVETFGVFPGQLAWPVSCSQTLYFGSGSVGFVCRKLTPFMANALGHGAVTDQGTAFNCSFQTSLQAVPDVHKIEVEPLVSRGANYGDVSLQATSSYTLGDDGGTAGTAQTVDLENTGLVRDIKGFNQSGRFLGLKMSWVSDVTTLRYKGAVLSGHPVEQY